MKNPVKSSQLAKSPRIFRKVALTPCEKVCENFREDSPVKDISTVESTVHGLRDGGGGGELPNCLTKLQVAGTCIFKMHFARFFHFSP